MDCPHCGGLIDTGALQPLEHTCFDDQWQHIVVGEERHYITPVAWRILRLMRERFRRFVDEGFLAQWSAADPAEGGSIPATKMHIMRVRVRLAGTPFAIANRYGGYYGLFPADVVKVISLVDGRKFISRQDRDQAHCTAAFLKD